MHGRTVRPMGVQRVGAGAFCGARWPMVIALLVVVGCTPPGLLIMPVSPRQELDETELYRDRWLALDKIALIDLSGVLVNSHRLELLGEGEHPVNLVTEQLDQAREDPAVKGVLLRINSPGGTVVASELIYGEIIRFREETGKPVVGMIMDLGTSGAYYAACACDEILAQPSTVTGSIGVVMQLFDVTGTMNMIGVSSTAIKSGPRKDMGSPFRAMQPEEREIFQGIVDDMYERFVRTVVEGRPDLDEATVRDLADGRVYTANQALESGLIDGITSLRDAVEVVKGYAGVQNARLVTYHRPFEYKGTIYARSGVPRAGTWRGDGSIVTMARRSGSRYLTPRFMYIWVPGLP